MEEIIIRNAKEKDLDDIVALENEIWPEGTRASRDKFEKRLRIFPEGFFVAYKNKEMIGVSTSERINYEHSNPPKSWEKVTDNGYIEKSHYNAGNSIYVVSIGAKSRSGGGSALLKAQKELAKKLRVNFLILGARIPGYNQYCIENKEISIEDYVVLKRKDSELLDSELRFYTRNGLRLVKIMPNYMEDDKESRNFGAIMAWENTGFT